VHHKIMEVLVPFLLTLIGTYLIIKFSNARKILDFPSEKSIHTKPTPMLGGVVVFIVFFISCGIFGFYREMMPLFWGGIIVLLGGIYDDLNGMGATQKVLIQLLCGIVFVSFGVVMHFIRIPFIGNIQLGVLSVPVTLLWFIAMANLINIIDGLDGLASGISAIVLAALTLFTWPETPPQILILFGALLGFLLFNSHPAKIFLGNNGSSFLGIAIAYFSITMSQKRTTVAILLIPCILLFIHIVDIIYAIVRRSRKNVNIFVGDKKHIHHIILGMIKSQQKTVLIFYLISFLATIVLFTVR
jgi:UDP-GlcNAc:undecaprenyl-phosphate/decaprenyl-phosphate GlcNAc-1-phosphate transferase